jgi:hypothetical protein
VLFLLGQGTTKGTTFLSWQNKKEGIRNLIGLIPSAYMKQIDANLPTSIFQPRFNLIGIKHDFAPPC